MSQQEDGKGEFVNQEGQVGKAPRRSSRHSAYQTPGPLGLFVWSLGAAGDDGLDKAFCPQVRSVNRTFFKRWSLLRRGKEMVSEGEDLLVLEAILQRSVVELLRDRVELDGHGADLHILVLMAEPKPRRGVKRKQEPANERKY